MASIGDPEVQIAGHAVSPLPATTAFGRLKYRLQFNPSRRTATVCIMILINVLNYMDRFTIAGIPDDVKRYYQINTAQLGLLQTCFFITYTILSPVFGYLGDRWVRKYLMQIGLSLWVAVTLGSSFVPADHFSLFVVTRCLVGIGEASYSTLAPTILSDLFVGSARTIVLGIFYLAVPIGSGLGYIIGSEMTLLTGNWQWSLRVTPILGIVCILLLSVLHKDPPRGQAEGGEHLSTTSWLADLKYLVCNISFMLNTAAFTCVSFVLGCLTWFAVDLMQTALSAKFDDPTAWRAYNVPLIFGASTCLAGILGVTTGTEAGRRLRVYSPVADTLVCSVSLFLCGPVLFICLLTPSVNFFLCLVLVFFVQYLLCICWALVSDMTMSVVIPTRRSTASAVQMIFNHALGDAISPSIIGAIAVAISDSRSLEMQYISLQRALFMTPFICVLSGLSFLLNSLYLLEGKEAVRAAIASAPHDPITVQDTDEGTTPCIAKT